MSQFSNTYQPETRGAGGQKKHKVIRDALMLALEREVENEGRKTKRITQIAEAICKKAGEGDVVAAKEIFDRIDGKSDANLSIGAADSLIEVLKELNAIRTGAVLGQGSEESAGLRDGPVEGHA